MSTDREFRLFYLAVLLFAAFALTACASSPTQPECRAGLERSPISGACAIEGTDAWYGEHAAAPATWEG